MSKPSARQNREHVVVLVHGIRDFAYWQSDVRQCLEAAGFQVELTNYDRFDLLRFLAPIPWFRNSIVERIWKQIEQVYQIHPGKKISFIAHSFGTFVLSEIMRRRFNFRAHRIIFCGSVARYESALEQVANRFDPPLLNEVGTRDMWPAIAQSATFGYGSAGSYGFKRPYARDRWHHGAGHGFFLNSDFCERFWVPFLETGKIVAGEIKPELPAWWVRLLHVVPVKFVAIALAACVVLYVEPWGRFTRTDTAVVEHWVQAAEEARRSGTIHPTRPMPGELARARTAFEEWWSNAGLRVQKTLASDVAFKALSYNGRLYRIYERQDDLKPNATYWSEQCLSFFEQIQNSERVTDCLLDLAALYLDISQIQHTNMDAFRRIAESGDRIMVRALALAGDQQKAELSRIASRFYYNLARPQDGLLSSPWSNNYLSLAVERAKAAYEKQPSEIRNVTQMSRSIQRMAANPPQREQASWTEELRRTQSLMSKAYHENRERLRSPEAHIPPANILAVTTMDLARRDWSASAKTSSDADKAIELLRADAIQPQTNAWALVKSTEWAKDYTFDLNYDLARIRSVMVQILDTVGSANADSIFEDATNDLKTAVAAASAKQLQAAFNSIDAEPSFSGLSKARRDRLRPIVSIQ